MHRLNMSLVYVTEQGYKLRTLACSLCSVSLAVRLIATGLNNETASRPTSCTPFKEHRYVVLLRNTAALPVANNETETENKLKLVETKTLWSQKLKTCVTKKAQLILETKSIIGL
jgi:hypothetical protein